MFEIAKTASGYASTPTTLVSFNGTDGREPFAGLIADGAGDLFGTTPWRRGERRRHGVRDRQDRQRLRQHADHTGQLQRHRRGRTVCRSDRRRRRGPVRHDLAGGASGLGTVFEITDSGFVTGFSLGDAANYAIIALDPHNFQGTSNSHIYGNVGVGPYQAIQLAGDTISGNLVTTGAPSPNTGGRVTGTITGHSASLATDIANLETLSSALGAEFGTLTFLSPGTTLNATSGTPDSSGNDVFTVTHWADNLTLSGSSSDHVVLDIEPGVQFALGNVTLTGGLTPNHVLFNYLGTNEVHGINNEVFNGTILAPDAKINVNGSTINGHLFGGAPGKISSLSETQIFISQSASCHLTAVAFMYEMLKLRAMDLTFLGSVPTSYSDGYWRPVAWRVSRNWRRQEVGKRRANPHRRSSVVDRRTCSH